MCRRTCVRRMGCGTSRVHPGGEGPIPVDWESILAKEPAAMEATKVGILKACKNGEDIPHKEIWERLVDISDISALEVEPVELSGTIEADVKRTYFESDIKNLSVIPR